MLIKRFKRVFGINKLVLSFVRPDLFINILLKYVFIFMLVFNEEKIVTHILRINYATEKEKGVAKYPSKSNQMYYVFQMKWY